jgi:hypothetical protein
MKRRTFLKLTGATAVLATTPLTFAAKKEIPQWVKLSDQLPDIDQKVVVCEVGPDDVSAWYGRVEKNDIQLMGGNKYVPYSLILWEYYDLYSKGKQKRSEKSIRKYPTFYPRIGEFNVLSFYGNKNSYRYWLPVEGEFPKILPPFPSLPSKWIAFEDQMPSNNEEIDVRDQNAKVAKGWYIKGDEPNGYFMPCEKDREWLNINLVTVNKLMWSWRYV